MTPALETLLILLVLLQVKHLFADYFLQTPRMLMNRGIYFHIGRIQHAGLHAAFSIIVFLGVGAPLGFVLVLCALEWLVHYHIDWIKGWYSEKAQDGPADAAYWRAFGTDQFMHQMTYVVMILAWGIHVL
ncbi:MAG: DUF3307 domain-containing protein [Pseudomonadota bacterium]